MRLIFMCLLLVLVLCISSFAQDSTKLDRDARRVVVGGVQGGAVRGGVAGVRAGVVGGEFKAAPNVFGGEVKAAPSVLGDAFKSVRGAFGRGVNGILHGTADILGGDKPRSSIPSGVFPFPPRVTVLKGVAVVTPRAGLVKRVGVAQGRAAVGGGATAVRDGSAKTF